MFSTLIINIFVGGVEFSISSVWPHRNGRSV